MRQFKKRIREEKSKLLMENARATSTTVAKRKRFLNTKKEASRVKRNERLNPSAEENHGDVFEGKRLVVGLDRTPNRTAPPVFAHVPRGAVKRGNASSAVEKEKSALNMQREKVIQRYRDLKHNKLLAMQRAK